MLGFLQLGPYCWICLPGRLPIALCPQHWCQPKMMIPTVAEKVLRWPKYIKAQHISQSVPFAARLVGFSWLSLNITFSSFTDPVLCADRTTVWHKEQIKGGEKTTLKNIQVKRAFTWCWEIGHRHFCFRRFSHFDHRSLFQATSFTTGIIIWYTLSSLLETLLPQAASGAFIFFHETVFAEAEGSSSQCWEQGRGRLHHLPPSKAA